MIDKDLKDKVNKIIDKYDGEQLWKESVKLAIKNNPKIAQQVLVVIRDNKELKATLNDPKYATTKTKSLRMGTRVPRAVDEILCLVDPVTFPINESQRDFKRFMKAFPEFCIPESV